MREALDLLTHFTGQPLASLNPARQEAVAMELRATAGAAVATLTRVVLQCYYRDDRVIRSLGLEPRPPYPRGRVLEDGDWSLLDPSGLGRRCGAARNLRKTLRGKSACASAR